MGDSVGLQVIAEGVETQQQSDFLTERGCTVLQGYRFSPALPAAQLEHWLQQRLLSHSLT
jgi:EAL domain-containing protein (putative c-di-GMP-specific phosphodiesterase class I)